LKPSIQFELDETLFFFFSIVIQEKNMKKKFSIHIPSSSLPTLLSISTWSARPRKKLIANSKKIIEKKTKQNEFIYCWYCSWNRWIKKI